MLCTYSCASPASPVSHTCAVCVGAVAMLFMFDLTQRWVCRRVASCRSAQLTSPLHPRCATRRGTLSGMKEWYRQVRGLDRRATAFPLIPHCPISITRGQVRGHNATALAFLVGTKYDLFYALDEAERTETLALARKYAKAMKAPLVFCSASHGINVQKLFKLVFQRVFSIEPDVEQKHDVADAVLEY